MRGRYNNMYLIYEQSIAEEGIGNTLKSAALAGAMAFGAAQGHAADKQPQPQPVQQTQQAIKQLDPSMYKKWGARSLEIIKYKTEAEAKKAQSDYYINTRIDRQIPSGVTSIMNTGSIQPLLTAKGYGVYEFSPFENIQIGDLIAYRLDKKSGVRTKSTNKSGTTYVLHFVTGGNAKDGFTVSALTNIPGQNDPWGRVTKDNYEGTVHKIFTWEDGNEQGPRVNKTLARW